MVAPAWGTFQKPNSQVNELEQEYSQEAPGQVADAKTPEGEKPQWGNFKSPSTFQGEPDPLEDESNFGWALRNFTANASRIGEQIAGFRGNVEKFAKDTLVSFPHTGGIIGSAVHELIGPEKWEKLIRGEGKQMLPTSEQLKEASQAATGGYTKPKTPGEARFQEFTEDVGSTLRGGNIPNAVNNFLIPAAANVAKQIVKETGFGEDKANLAKLAVWLPLSMSYNISAQRYASDLMNQGRNGVPQNIDINVPRFLNRLQTISTSPHLLTSDPRSALARQQITAIQNDIQNGQTSVRTFMNVYDGVNAAKRNRGMFELNRSDQNFARRSIDLVRDAVRDEVMDAANAYPNALGDWRNGIQAWATIHRSNALTNEFERLATGKYAKMLSGPAAALFGAGGYSAAKAPFVTGTAAAVIPAAYKTGQVSYRMWNNESLRSYYFSALNDLSEQNIPSFISNYNKLNKGLEESSSRTPKAKSKKD